VSMPLLSLILWLPLLGGVFILFIDREQKKAIRTVALLHSLAALGLSLGLWLGYDRTAGGFQFVERADWIPAAGISYFLAVDGISLPLIVLTALLTFVAVVASWNIEHRVKDYFALLLLLGTAMFGVFMALDLILFYVFFELVLVPMYFLIGVWGGPRREYAAIKFFLYTLLGSVIMLVGILALYFGTGARTFDVLALMEMAPGAFAFQAQRWIFLALWFGFAVKVPVFPFHTWLPDAHVEAPTAVSVILAGVLLKMGTYGFLRFTHPLLPEAAIWFAPTLAVLGVIGMIYGALTAMWQRDLKKLVAYSSISHMGFMLLGIAALTPQGVNGAIFYMVAHGLATGMLFLLVGVVYERTHTRDIPAMRGFYFTMPVWAVIMAFTGFASLGLPGLAPFIGEFFTLLGAYLTGDPFFQLMVYIGVLTIVLAAGYILWMIQRMLMGEEMEEFKGIPDADARELVTLVPPAALIVLLGVWPRLLVDITNPAVMEFIRRVLG